MSKDWRKRSKRGYFISTVPEYEALLKDETIREWIANLKRKSGWRTTVPSFLRTLHKFAEYSSKSPKELIAIASIAKKLEKPEELTPATPAITGLILGYVNKLLSSGKQESARQARTCLTSFLKANGISLKLESIPRVYQKEEVTIHKEQIYAIADFASSLRNRTIILCMYQSGLGITSLRNLNYGSVEKQLEKDGVSTRIRLAPPTRRKPSQVPVYAFLGAEASDSLKVYINDRKRKIKKMRDRGFDIRELTSKSPLFASEGKNVPFGDRMAVSSIWRIIKDSAERAGLEKEKIRPNSLTKAFEKELKRSVMDEETKKYLMGNPIPGMKYNVDEVEQSYLMCDFGRAELGRLAIIKEFVQLLGIKEVETKVQKILAKSPQMTEMDALRFIVRAEFCHSTKSLR